MPVTAMMAAKTASMVGEAKTSPQTAAVSMPLPTKAACAGSWPDPPPAMMATRFESWSVRSTTLMPG